MNVVVLSNKRTKKIIESAVKNSRLITVVGYEGQIKASTAGHIYEFYKLTYNMARSTRNSRVRDADR